MLRIKFLSCMLCLVAIFTACKKDTLPDNPIETNDIIIAENNKLEAATKALNPKNITTFLTGIIKDESGNPLRGVSVSYGTNTQVTDADGRFTFGEITMTDAFNVIKATKSGYLEGFKTFTPTANSFNILDMQLLSKGTVQNLNAISGGTLTIDSKVQLDFPANSIVTKSGSAYTGTVKVYGRYLNPKSENFSQIIIGALVGLNNDGDFDALISRGMLTVELEDNNGNALEIAKDKKVAVTMPADGSSEVTIPFWHFNEQYGLWIEAGVATKSGDTYKAEVNHFSSWNLDFNEEGYDVDVTIQNQSSQAIANQAVIILSEDDDVLARVHTDQNGQFTLLIAPATLKFRLDLPCNTNVASNAIDISSGVVTVKLNPEIVGARSYTIRGTVSDCDVNGDAYTYNNKYFTLSNEANNLYFGGLTNASGQYSLTTILCSNISTSTTLPMQAIANSSASTQKDITVNITFSGTSQTANIDFCGINNDTISDDFEIPFGDYWVAQSIRDILDLPAGPITYGDVKDIDTIHIGYISVSSLSGLEYLINLKYLSVYSERISDISPLSGLTNLEYLSLPNKNIKDISHISGLVKLIELDLGRNQIIDISPLNKLKKLKKLTLYQNQIVNISSLSELTNLQELELSENTIVNINSLSGLTDLQVLNLYNNQIVNITSLSGLTNLINLNLSKNQIVNITSLSGLSKLQSLSLSYNKINNISSLSGLTNLTGLGLSFNNIEAISSLCNLGNSFNGNIYLDFNPISNTEQNNLKSCLPNARIMF